MWKVDTGKSGISTIFTEYQYGIIKLLLAADEGVLSSDVHAKLEMDGIKVSRASVINFLNKLADGKVLSWEEKTGKGGYHRVYTANVTFEQLIQRITNDVLVSLLNAFPKSDYLKFLNEGEYND